MYKKITTIALAGAMALALSACGSSSSSASTANSSASAATTKATASEQTTATANEVENVFRTATSGVYATVKIDSSVKMYDSTAWLGLCPLGTDYTTEISADENDIIFFYVDTRENDSDPYVFACDFEPVEDGKYALVVCTSDMEEFGYVAIQMEMEKKGDKLSFDYSTAKIKEKPAK